MNNTNQQRAPSRRQPLSDGYQRANCAGGQTFNHGKECHADIPHHESLWAGGQLQVPGPATASCRLDMAGPDALQRQENPSPTPEHATNIRISTISKESKGGDSNRNSQVSTTSTNASDGRKRKTHIGPWQLGKTLGKGATARVRLARHSMTGQNAAVKIIQKKNAQISQSGSLASLDRDEAGGAPDGQRRMPYGIEREVAIMKLIEHPHIIKLYDIWENRTEIYLVLEYVNDGELFEHITRKVKLEEEEAMKYFRQMLSAMACCHSFGICHRDLKPENILLNRDGIVKIADFGMAALQQGPTHKLKTSCGSPHYAAPEVISSKPYRGDKVDVWSLGIILYAELTGCLPFDHDNVRGLLTLVQAGIYKMPTSISRDAQDLIYRMLQVNPKDRITMNQIWKHPLIKKYGYLDDLGSSSISKLPDAKTYGRPVASRSDIDKDVLRHLRAMWHTLNESQIVNLLLNESVNDQKLFYSLFLKHREMQLENYVPIVEHSKSDYHHAKPLVEVRKFSTRQFHQPKQKGHKKQTSRFTVISNLSKSLHTRNASDGAGTEGGDTVHSYDPFRASRPQQLGAAVCRGRAPIQNTTVDRESFHRESNGTSGKPSVACGKSLEMSNHKALVAPKLFISRSSLASSTMSRNSARGTRVGLASKRGVSFPHVRKGSSAALTKSQDHRRNERHSRYSEVTDDGGSILRAVTSPPSHGFPFPAKQTTGSASQPQLNRHNNNRASGVWQEDVYDLRKRLANDCDEAFNGISVTSTNRTHIGSSLMDNWRGSVDTPPSSIVQSTATREKRSSKDSNGNPSQATTRNSWNARPLPPAPSRSDSVKNELMIARKQAEQRRTSGNTNQSASHLDRIASHIDRLMQPSPLRIGSKRRVVSAPADSYLEQTENREALHVIDELLNEDNNVYNSQIHKDKVLGKNRKALKELRHASAPEKGHPYDRTRVPLPDSPTITDDVFRTKKVVPDIRIVHGSSPSPAKPPAPLRIRKQRSNIANVTQGATTSMTGALFSSLSDEPAFPVIPTGGNSRAYFATTLSPESDISNTQEIPSSSQEIEHSLPKKSANWFRRTYSKTTVGDHVHTRSMSQVEADDPPLPTKKKSFGLSLFFGKRTMKHGDDMADNAFAIHNDEDSMASADDLLMIGGPKAAQLRQIEPQQNWLARLFHVKPAKRHICFSVSKQRARRELASLLKEWRKFGVRDVVVEKRRNMIFARVAAKNYLEMKPVSFACEIMTVMEHGRRFPMSIVRVTQEKGAASSFHKVVDTLEIVLKSRGMLISDDRKKAMIIKTLNTV